jgi:DNA-binding GntR family transcriptional regulator
MKPRSELSPSVESSPALSAPAESSTQTAYRVVKQAIIDGRLPPAGSVSELQLASQLRMSRTPVHQALVLLEQEGWLKVNSRRGVQIAPLIAEDMAYIYETLMALEGAAARRLASRSVDDVDTVDESLTRACAACEHALGANDLTAWALADNEFHTLLVESSGNPHLARQARPVMEQAHRARLLTVRLRPWPSSSNEDHRRIVKEITARHPLAARAALEEHRRRGMQTLIPILEAMVPNRDGFLL